MKSVPSLRVLHVEGNPFTISEKYASNSIYAKEIFQMLPQVIIIGEYSRDVLFSSKSNKSVLDDVSTMHFKLQIQSLESAISLQELVVSHNQRASESSSSAESRFPYVSLLQEWRRKVTQCLYDQAVMMQRIQSQDNIISKLKHQLKLQHDNHEASILTLREHLRINKLHLDDKSEEIRRLSQEICAKDEELALLKNESSSIEKQRLDFRLVHKYLCCIRYSP